MLRARLTLGAVVTALTLSMLGGCSGSGPQAAPTTSAPTPIARLNTAQMDLHRIPFCDLVPREAVRAALGRPASARASWGNGDTTRFVGGSGDRSQEFGCHFAARDAVAEAWVFASPVGRGLAAEVARDTSDEKGCRNAPGPTFGSPSRTEVCDLPGGDVRVRHAGLFGRTWLTCQVSSSQPEPQVGHRADAWCVQVANALNTAR